MSIPQFVFIISLIQIRMCSNLVIVYAEQKVIIATYYIMNEQLYKPHLNINIQNSILTNKSTAITMYKIRMEFLKTALNNIYTIVNYNLKCLNNNIINTRWI
jgi:hypothetical protein